MTWMQCRLSDREFSLESWIHKHLYSAFNVALQTEKKKKCFLDYRHSPSPIPLFLCYINLYHPDGKRSRMCACNYQPVLSWCCPRWMAFCKSTLGSGLHDGKSGFWHFFNKRSKMAPFPPLLPVNFKGVIFVFLRYFWPWFVMSVSHPNF